MRSVPLLAGLLLCAACSSAPPPPVAPPSLEERAQAVLAQTSGTLRLAGLQKPVTVLRDPWGIPHIYAETQEDLFFAQGFVAAQDRLFQMELMRRGAQGRLAELAGPAEVWDCSDRPLAASPRASARRRFSSLSSASRSTSRRSAKPPWVNARIRLIVDAAVW